MIIVAGSVTIRSDRREEAIRAARAMAEATAREPGCISYRFSSDLVDPDQFFIFEEWESEDALARHFQTEHMKAFREKLPGIVAGAGVVKRYVVTSVSAMA